MNTLDAPTRPAGAVSRVWTIVAVAALLALLALAWQRGWLTRLADHDELVHWMRRDGSAGPLICIGIQFMQVVIFAIPGEITQVAAGYVFGPWWGFLYSIVGILLGSAFDFGFARAVGRPVMRRILGERRLSEIDSRLRSRKGLLAVFVLFLVPGAPKDAMSYGAGLTALRLPVFLSLSVPARMPALLLSTIFGAEAYDGDYATMLVIAAVAALWIAGAAYYYRRRRSN